MAVWRPTRIARRWRCASVVDVEGVDQAGVARGRLQVGRGRCRAARRVSESGETKRAPRSTLVTIADSVVRLSVACLMPLEVHQRLRARLCRRSSTARSSRCGGSARWPPRRARRPGAGPAWRRPRRSPARRGAAPRAARPRPAGTGAGRARTRSWRAPGSRPLPGQADQLCASRATGCSAAAAATG